MRIVIGTIMDNKEQALAQLDSIKRMILAGAEIDEKGFKRNNDGSYEFDIKISFDKATFDRVKYLEKYLYRLRHNLPVNSKQLKDQNYGIEKRI